MAVAYSHGQLCRHGAGDKCNITPQQPAILSQVDCPTCSRDPERLRIGCPTCGGWGHPILTECPLKGIPAETWEVIEAAELAAKGHWPILAGWLDQSRSFVDAARFVWNEQARWKLSLTDH